MSEVNEIGRYFLLQSVCEVLSFARVLLNLQYQDNMEYGTVLKYFWKKFHVINVKYHMLSQQ